MPKRDWEKIYRDSGDLKYEILPIIRRISGISRERGYTKILDLACGTGKHSIYLAKKGFPVYATDLSPKALEIAKNKAKSLMLDNIHFKRHDMRIIPFGNSFFDTVICAWAIYHGTLEQVQKTVNEIQRVLKTGGLAVVDFLSVDDNTFGIGEEIEKDTFIGAKEPEEDVPHHYTTRTELINVFIKYQELKIRKYSRSYTGKEGKKFIRKYYNVIAEK